MSHHESLARSAHDRNYLRRSDPGAWWEEPGTRAIVSHRGRTLVSRRALLTFDRGQIPADQLEIFLGTVAGGPGDAGGGHRIGIVLDDEGRAALDAELARQASGNATGTLEDEGLGADSIAPVWLGLRDIGTLLNETDTGLITELVALGNWHAAHRFSPVTGQATEVAESGWVRRDPDTGREHFPRTDAAIIVAVIHRGEDGEERVLLAHNSMWEAGRYSVLAGFVEPGETLEAAVVREVAEETGIIVDEPTYFGSQPWPFPASLMLGFFAVARAADIRVDGKEITDARWFTRRELAEGIGRGELGVPGEISIAGHLLRSWRERQSGDPR